MAWTTPGTATAGEVLTAAFWNTNVRDNSNEVTPIMTAWVTHTPTIAQGATNNIAKTTNYSKYLRVGKLIIWQFDLTVTGTGTGANPVTLTLPANVASSHIATAGAGMLNDASTSTAYSGSWISISNLLYFVGDWSSTGTWGSAPNIAVANNDTIRGTVTYEVA